MATRSDLVQRVLEGIKSGQAKYEEMSGGCWVWEGAEYWLTVHVALSLWDLVGDGQVTVENQSNETMAAAGRRRGRPRIVVDNKRFDIVLWHKNGTSRAPVEIKSQQIDKNLIIKDVKRVIGAVKQSKMKFGIVGYYFSRTSTKGKTAIERIDSYVEDIEKMCMEIEENRIRVSSHRSESYGDEEYAWIAGCLLIEER